MLLEFQLSSDTLGRIVRNLLHNIDLCVKEPFDFQNMPLMVDRILVLPETILRRAPATFQINVNDSPLTLDGCSKAVLAQPLQFNLVPVSSLKTNGENPTPPILSPQLTILIDITASVAKGEASLQFSFNSIDFEATKPDAVKALLENDKKNNGHIEDDIESRVSARVPTITQKIDVVKNLQSVPILKGIPLAITNAGVTASEDGNRLLLRVEVNGAKQQALDWQAFYTTYNRNMVGDGNWAMLIDKGIIIPTIKNMISASLADAKDSFSLDGGIDVSWTPSVGPIFEIAFSGEVIDACTCAWQEQDVDVDVSSTLVLEAGSSDTLYMGVNTTYDANDAEVACCALTASAFWPVVGLIYLGKDDGGLNFGTYLLGYVLSPIGFTFMAVCQFAGDKSITDYLSLPGECTKNDDEMFSCHWPFKLNMGAFGGTYHLTKVSAEKEGPVLSGTTAGITDLSDPELAIKSMGQFAWNLGGSCSTGFAPQLTAHLLYYNVGFGTIFKICDVSVLEADDPQHVFKVVKVGTYGATVRAVLSSAYLANPYPCNLQIVSNGGVRIITLPPPKDITEQEKTKLQDDLSTAKKLCYAVSITVPKTIIKWMQPDPSEPITIDNAQIWQVVVAELTNGESVDLLVHDRVMASAIAGGRGVAHVSFWSDGQEYHDEIALQLNAPGSRPASTERDVRGRHVSVKQTQLILQSRIGFAGDFEDMAFVKNEGRTLLSIRTSEREVQYDVSIPQFPYLMSSLMRTGVTREAVVRDGLHVFHDGEEAARVVMASVATEGVVHLEGVKLAGFKRAVAVSDRSRITRILDLSDRNKATEIGRYFHIPWFIAARRSGHIFGKLAADGKHISLYDVQRVIDS